ncbi:hypothetical protein HDU87_002275 [Geranomyces variabilis]|uniref:Elongator complex protein 5 n=1 Tax=Geranomyces variabilis TaxID=109894 RepID=A0AAD5TN36_9FUNG|nr:hypothetical protein HDU87_002275 [Geranomyces variabilis]
MAPANAQLSSQLVLARLLAGKEQSSFIVVEDSLRQSALPLVQKLAAQSTPRRGPPDTRRNDLVVCCVENPPRVVRELFPYDGAVFVDVFSSYSLAPPRTQPGLPTATAATIGEYLSSLASKDVKTTVVFDSINPFVTHHSIGAFARLLKRLAGLSDSISLILPFHGDCVPRSVHTLLGDIAVTVLTVRHAKDFGVALGSSLATDNGDAFRLVDANATGGAVVEVMHKRKSGKITREVAVYTTDGDKWRLNTLEQVRGSEDLVEEKKSIADEPDPTANLSFNLKLTDEQRAARSEVVLPYLYMQQADGAGTVQQHQMQQPTVSSAEAAIYYDDDDYDEEDPDADLDI